MKSTKLAVLAVLAVALTAGGLPAQDYAELPDPAATGTPSGGAESTLPPASPSQEPAGDPAATAPATVPAMPEAVATEPVQPTVPTPEPSDGETEEPKDDEGYEPVVGGGFPVPGPNTPMVTDPDGTVRSAVETDISAVHDSGASTFSTRNGGASTAGAAARSGTMQVTLVFATLTDNRNGVDQNAARKSITEANKYWRTMSNNRLGMEIVNTRSINSTANSGMDYVTMMNKIRGDLNWYEDPNEVLVVFVPAGDLRSGGSGGILGGGWTSGPTSGSVLMPRPSGFTNNVVTHELGHVLGLLHANSLKCNNGRSDVGRGGERAWADGSCTSREYGDTSDLMGYAQYASPAINSLFWDEGGFGRGDEIMNAGTPRVSTTYTLRAWAGSASNRAVKFKDPSGETYYVELRLPVGYDSSTAVGGNRGVKVVKRDLANNWALNSLVVAPNTRDFAGYTNANSTWQSGQTFTTHAGTSVRINSIDSTSASVTVTPKLVFDWSKKVLSPGDFNSDGKADLLTRRADGTLWFSAGLGNGTFGGATKIGTGFEVYNAFISTGDYDGDGKDDFLARHVDGSLWRYSGTGVIGSGQEGYKQGQKIGMFGWEGFDSIIGAGDANSDGRSDIIARAADGKAFLYAGTGKGQHGPSRVIASDWNKYNALVGTRDFNGDGHADVLARTFDGNVHILQGNGGGTFNPGPTIGSGWGIYTDIIGGTDFNRDGRSDLIGYRSTGALSFYAGTGRVSEGYTAAMATSGLALSSGSKLISPGDFNDDKVDDLISVDREGTLWIHPGTGTDSGAYRAAIRIGSGWNIYTDIAAGDFNRDGRPDLVSRDSDGALWFNAGTGRVNATDEGYMARKRIGTGWNVYSEVAAAGDLNGDQVPDILARHKNGSLWFYAGNGRMGPNNEGYHTGSKIGNNGWDVFTSLTAAGDYDRNGTNDILGTTAGGSLFLYRGDGRGGLRTGDPVGSGWNIFTSLVGPGDTTVASRYGFTGIMPNGNSRFYKSNGMADEGYQHAAAAGNL